MYRLISVLVLLLLVSAVQAQSLSVIELENRPAAEVIPIVQPMLGDNDAITGEGYKIFLRASPATLASVREMIDFLDTPARVLEVSVFQGSARDLRALAASASVQIDSGNVRVDVGDEAGDDPAGGSIRYSTSDGSASVSGLQTQESLRNNPVHRVRVTEGTEAYIETGKRIPYFYTTGVLGRRGYVAGVEYRDAVTGFYVLPRVRGDNVVLEVSPFKNTQLNTGRDNEIVSQSASTTVTGRVGEWLMIGGVTQQVERSDNVTGSTISTQGGTDTGIWIRADVVQ